MANLEDPNVANSRVKDLDGRLSRSIYHCRDHIQSSLSQALFYAAQYWTTHIVCSSGTHSEELLDALSRFCNQHLFHWLELLSLISSLTYSTQRDLHAVIRWTEVRCSSSSLLPANMSNSALLTMPGCSISVIYFATPCTYCRRTPSLYGLTRCMPLTVHM
jgi:hypothetical protein